MLLIYVDTSPSVIIAPTTYFHHVQHAEEFRESPAMWDLCYVGHAFSVYYHLFFFFHYGVVCVGAILIA